MAQQVTHSQQLKNPKYRNWAKAGLGLKYLKEGLETFSHEVVNQQHADFVNAVQKKHNLPTLNCARCNLRTLQPNHVRNKNRQCPLGQKECNCMFPGGKVTCPNNVCGAIYDEIIINHASNPPAPFWKNTDMQHWCTDAWAVAKCYINAPGYATKRNAQEIDCTGLLHLYINSKYLQGKIQCKITGQDVFTKTRSARNTIYHSDSMEMEDNEVDAHIDNMIAVLEDGKELLHNQESQDAVNKLKELKNTSFIISAQDEALVIKETFIEIDQRINNLKETIQKGGETLTKKANESLQAVQKTREQLESRAKEILEIIEKAGSDVKQDIAMELKKALDALNVNAASAEKTISKHTVEACSEIGQIKDAAMQSIKTTHESMNKTIEANILKHKKLACTEMEQMKNNAIDTIKGTSENMRTAAEKDILKHRLELESCTEIGLTKTAARESINATKESMTTSVEETILKCKDEACREIGQTKEGAVNSIITTNESIKTSVERTLIKQKEDTCREIEQTKDDVIENIRKAGEIITTTTETNILTHKEEACTEIEQQKTDALEKITASVDIFTSKVDSSESILYSRIKKVEEKFSNTSEDTNNKKIVYSMQLEAKKDFQRSLVEMYLENVVKVSPVLLQPENTDVVISQLYVDPYLEIEPRDKHNTQGKRRVETYPEIFEKDEKPLKLIYLIGEAGSGKSTFCIDMIHKWCLAHSEQPAQESENVQFMKKFKYLFHIYLRHNMDADHIETMIKNHYENDILESILAEDAGDCLILLDGLDEWSVTGQQTTVSQFQTKGLPRRDIRKKYSVITTSRPWKFETLNIKTSEVHQTLRLHGVYDVKEMARKTINELNEMFRKNKNKDHFEKHLSKCPFDDMKRLPMVLQQLVCLWFEGKLEQFGKCEIFSNMISLYFEWADSRNPDDRILKDLKGKSIRSKNVILPNQCTRTELCEDFKCVIHHIARLAYETLFSEEKELSLSFNNSLFKRLEIPEEVIQCCQTAGILSEEREVGLYFSRRKQLSYSFAHKSLQEFFAAVFLYTEIKQRSPLMFEMYTIDTLDENLKCLQDLLGSCKTMADILVQSTVISYLCGFDTYLTAHVSKFLYNIAHEDDLFIAYREDIMYEPFKLTNILQHLTNMGRFTIDFHGQSADIVGIQDLILSCIKEAMIPEGKSEQLFFLADIVYKDISFYKCISNIELLKYVKADYVSSLSFDLSESPKLDSLFDILNDLGIGRHLTTLKIKFSEPVSYKAVESLLKYFVTGDTTLKCIFLESQPGFRYYNLIESFFHYVIKMLHNLKSLRSLKLERISLSYSDIMELCSFLTKATYLQQISLRHITDNPDPKVWYQDNPTINLSNHCHLRFLDHDYDIIDLVYFKAIHLETCAMRLLFFSNIKTAFRMLKASQCLKHLYLTGDPFLFDKSVKALTNQFRSLLPFLKCLTSLELEEYEFNENIFDLPLEMKNLRTITLRNVNMRATGASDSFIESILAMPQNVNVEVWNSYCDGFYDDIFRAALKRKSLLHNLKFDRSRYTMFSSKHDADI